MFSRFDTIHERDRQTDGRTDRHRMTVEAALCTESCGENERKFQFATWCDGATENAGLELNGPTKFGGWKMQDWN